MVKSWWASLLKGWDAIVDTAPVWLIVAAGVVLITSTGGVPCGH